MCHSSARSFKPKILDREGNAYLLIFLLLQMSKVSWYKQRLKALLFKARFADKVEEIKPVRSKLSLLVSRCLGFTDRKSSQLSASCKRQTSHLSNLCACGCLVFDWRRMLTKQRMIVGPVCSALEEFENVIITGVAGVFGKKKSGREITQLSLYHHFQKALQYLQKISVHTKTKCRLRSPYFKRFSKSDVFLTSFKCRR